MPPPYPILLLTRNLDVGGSERQLVRLALELDRARFQPHVGCFRKEGLYLRELEERAIPVEEFPVRSFQSLGALKAARQLGDYLERHTIRLVHSFDVPANLFAVPVARAYRCPVVLSSQRAYRHLTPGLPEWLLRLTDAAVDGVVVNCLALREDLTQRHMLPASLVHVCYNGVDADTFHPEPRRRMPPVAEADLVIGVAAVFRPEKALHVLVEAFARVCQAAPGLRLVLIGEGETRPALERLSAELGLGEQCLFIPPVRDVAGWLRSIDIFVLPSVSEGFSNALLEAMACGCAPVATRVGGNVELIGDDERGLLFEPGDTATLAAHLRLLVENEAVRRSFSSRAARFVHERFTARAAADRMAEIYESFLAPPDTQSRP